MYLHIYKGRFPFGVFYCADWKILVDFYCADFHFIFITFIDIEKCSVLFDWYEIYFLSSADIASRQLLFLQKEKNFVLKVYQ